MRLGTANGMVLIGLMLGASVYGQDKPKVDPPNKVEAPKVDIKPEVRMALLKEQNELWRLNQQMRDMEDQFNVQKKALQDQFASKQQAYQRAVIDGLAKSGLDGSKYKLDPLSLEVSELPQPPKAEPVKKP